MTVSRGGRRFRWFGKGESGKSLSGMGCIGHAATISGLHSSAVFMVFGRSRKCGMPEFADHPVTEAILRQATNMRPIGMLTTVRSTRFDSQASGTLYV